MTEQEIKNLVTKQRNYFLTGATLPVSTRIDALHRLYAAITEHEKEINDALRKDLGKQRGLPEKKECGRRLHSFIPEVTRNHRPTA